MIRLTTGDLNIRPLIYEEQTVYQTPPKGMETALFVCIHNSARSQMAEAFVNRLAAGRLVAYSAGLQKGNLNPDVVEAMKEIGYDLSKNTTKSLFDKEFNEFAKLHPFDYVVTVCDESSAEKCPIFPSKGVRLHWGFADPSSFAAATRSELMAQVREVRDAIEREVKTWLATLKSPAPR